ncbi:SBBP repeat-containing protein [Myxococcus landrumensis]|uniref:SBBP repeat-containing protein n=1 Tax=Myxococcus landrumensis TaxID=2813577 RepID=A0ABX7NM80_9BACT|nr:SBBP repeat-containing protein [Myxococcus landrumus]
MVPTGPLVGDSLRWLVQIGTPDEDRGHAVAATREGVYSAGYSTGSFDGNVPVGSNDVIIAKHLASGARVWSKQLGTASQDVATSIATYSVPNPPQVYVTGHTRGSWFAANAGDYDVFLIRVDPASGAVLWGRQFGTATGDQAFGVATDPSGSVYVAGHTTGSLASTSSGGLDAFVAKFDANGNQLWIRQFGTPQAEVVRGVAADANNNVYVVGQTAGALGGPNQGLTDLFVVKYDTGGTQVWRRQMGTATSESVYGVATSRRLSGVVDVYVVGYTGASFDGQPYNGGFDAIIVKLDGLGNRLWSRQMGTAGSELALAIASDGGANVYIVGTSTYDLDTNTPDSSENYFMAKYDSGGGLLLRRQLGSVNTLDPSAQTDTSQGVAADINDSVYLTGYTEGGFTNPVTTNQGGTDYVLARYEDGCQINTPGQCGLGYGWGDPHLGTFDGRAYDFQGVGEFIVVENVPGTPALTVQARTRPWGASGQVSVMTAVATKLGANRVGIYTNGAAHEVKVDGAVVSIPTGTTQGLPDGGRILRQEANAYLLYYPGMDRLLVTVSPGYLNLNFALPASRQGKVRGLLGNYNLRVEDDFALRSGTVLTPPLSFAQLYTGSASMASSWRITQQESLFDYATGENTSTHTNVNFPDGPVSVNDLPPAQREQARARCLEAKVKGPFFLDSCIVDFALTQDPTFLTTTARVEAQVQTQAGGQMPQPVPAGSRVYFAGFQGAAGTEWSERGLTTSPLGGKTFLGEFTSQDVRLSLKGLPAHTSVTVSFDLLILRAWDGNGPFGPNTWGLTANGVTVLERTFSNTRSTQSYPLQGSAARTGSDANNTLGYESGDSIYRMKVKVDSTSSELLLDFYARGLSGLANEAWGLDNVEVQVE